MNPQKTIWTIGHSTRSIEEFINLLHLHKIMLVADVRSYPGSKYCPQFNKEILEKSLNKATIKYVHFIELGGRRKVQSGSRNTAWKNKSFQGYADYMESAFFKNAIIELENTAKEYSTAIMCSEALWWRCHRSMIADYLKQKGWTVIHIMSSGIVQEHEFTKPARISEGHLTYYQ